MTQAAMNKDSMVAVTQADRDLAAVAYSALGRDGLADAARRGQADHAGVVRAFARHRIQSEGRTGAGED